MKTFTLMLMMVFIGGRVGAQPIFATISGGDLYSFDITNCTRHFIGSTGHLFVDIAFTPDGKLWGIEWGNIYEIDTSNASTTLVDSSGIGSVTLVALNDSIFLAEFGKKLYEININAASSYYIDSIGYAASGDLTWYDNDLYMVTAGNRIIKIVMDSNYSSILSVTALGDSVPPCAGAITAAFSGDNNSIVGFNGANLIKICQIDGSYQMLCPSLNINGTPGAASIRLATQIPPPTVCHITNSIEDICSLKLSITPNPAQSLLTIQTPFTNNNASITVFDASGRKILLPATFINKQVQINTLSLAAGMYLVQVMDEKTGKSVTGKFVKE